jgi:hypothetical protein
MSDQDDGKANEQPATDRPLDGILLFGGFGGKREGVHEVI